MKVYQVVYILKGRQDDAILQADSATEAKTLVKMEYGQVEIKPLPKTAI